LKKINKKLLATILTGVLAVSLILSGCSGGGASTVTSTAHETATLTTTKTTTLTTTSIGTTTTTLTQTAELSGKITEAGSTTVQPLAEDLAAAFMEIFPQVNITIGSGGTGVGITSASDGTVNIGAASRALKESEQGLGLVAYTLAYDGIAIITPDSQTVSALSKDQIIGIFSGTIKNWSEVGGSNRPIVVVSREEGSGTRTAFQDLVMGANNLITADALLQNTTAGVKLTVAGNPDAIGYISFGYLDSTIKALDVGGIKATVENAKNGTYPIVRPLLFLTKGEATGITKKFIDFCQGSAAQAIVSKDYISILD
jgi:phosphate transport system substrate-binding protein